MNRFFRSALFPLIVIVLLVYLASLTLIPRRAAEKKVTYSQLIQKENVKFDSKGKGSSGWWTLLTSLLPFVIIIAFWIFLMNQMQGGGSKGMSFGKSRAT